MPNLHKKSWIVSDIHGVKINHFLQRMGWKWKARIWFILAGLLTISASIFPLSSRNDLILLDRLKEAQSPSQYAPKRLAIRFQQHQFRSISGDTIILARGHNYRDDLITDSKFSATKHSCGVNATSKFFSWKKTKHIRRNPRFDLEQHLAEIWDIGQILKYFSCKIRLFSFLVQYKTFHFYHENH